MCVKFSVYFKEGNNVELYIHGTVVNNVSLILYISIIIWLFLLSVNFITVMDVKFVTVMVVNFLFSSPFFQRATRAIVIALHPSSPTAIYWLLLLYLLLLIHWSTFVFESILDINWLIICKLNTCCINKIPNTAAIATTGSFENKTWIKCF